MENKINDLREISQLYDEFIVAEEVLQIPPKEKEKIKNSPKISGGIGTGILMIYNSIGKMPELEREMLDNLLVNALKQDKSQVSWLNMKEQVDLDLDKTLSDLSYTKVIIWGIGDANYQLVQNGGMQIIKVEAVAEYLNNVALKRKLWESIKPMFKLL